MQAMGKATASLLLSISRQGIVHIPLLYILSELFALSGLILAQPITDACMAVFAIIILLSITKKNRLMQGEVKLSPLPDAQDC